MLDVFPGTQWSLHESPKAVGWSSNGPAAVRAFTRGLDTPAVVIVQGGLILDP